LLIFILKMFKEATSLPLPKRTYASAHCGFLQSP